MNIRLQFAAALLWGLGSCAIGLQAADVEARETPSVTEEGLELGNGGAGLEEEDDLSVLLEDPPGEEPAKTEEEAKAKEEPKAPAPAEKAEPAKKKSSKKKEAGAPKAEAKKKVEEAAPVAEDLLPPEPQPKPKAKASAPRAPRRAAAAPGSDQEIFKQLGLTREARQEEAKNLVKQARGLVDNNELVKAEGRLEEATMLDPENDEAHLLLSQVRLLLGDSRGEIFGIARSLSEDWKVRQQQAALEIRRLINEASRQREEGEYSKAVDALERAIESIRNFPFNLNLDAELREAQGLLAKAKEENKAKEEVERQKHQRMVAETREAEEKNSVKLIQNQIRELRRKGKLAEDEKKYERAITMYERILEINARDDEARESLANVKQVRHSSKMQEYLEKAMENYDLAVLGIEESSVTYQQIFRYPEKREWERITPKLVTIEEEVAASESSFEKEIKRKLDQPIEIGFEDGVPLKQALGSLQSYVQVNFILNKDGSAEADKVVKLPRFPDLPLRNVLTLILESVSPDFGYAIKEGAVVIGPKTSLKTKEYLKFYEISDLIQDRPDFKAPPLALDEFRGKTTGAAGAAVDLGLDTEEKKAGGLNRDKLLELIKKEIGEEGVDILQGKLSARTTIENHLKLAKLLDQFRKSTGMMVTVESRFLDIQDNFLEEIGMDFGSPNQTFLPNSIPDIDGAGTSVAPGYEYVNPSGTMNQRIASIAQLSQPLGSEVNPFNMSTSGGGALQINVLNAERYQIEAILVGVAKQQEIRRLNSPRVTAFNGQIAHTIVVNQAAYIQDLEVNQTGVIPVINPVIDVLNSGSILEVRPTIGYDRKYVVLEIQPTLAEQLASDIAVLNLSGNFTVVPVTLPVLSVTKIKTTVTVPDGGTVLVGGLKREIASKAAIGIPGFLDIPILNLIAGRKGQSNLRSNLFVLINAKITVVHEEEERLFGT